MRLADSGAIRLLVQNFRPLHYPSRAADDKFLPVSFTDASFGPKIQAGDDYRDLGLAKWGLPNGARSLSPDHTCTSGPSWVSHRVQSAPGQDSSL